MSTGLVCAVCDSPLTAGEATRFEGEHYCRICVRALRRHREGREAVLPGPESVAPTTPGLSGVTGRAASGAVFGGALWWAMIWVFPAFPCAFGALVTGWLTARLARIGLPRHGARGAVLVVGALVATAVLATEVLVNLLALPRVLPSRDLFERAFAQGLPARPEHLLILIAVSVPFAVLTLARGRAARDPG